MRTSSLTPIVARALAALTVAGIVAALAPISARAEAKASPQLAPEGAPKSEFTFRPGFNRDPFFPRSKDNQPAVTTQTETKPSAQPSIPDFVLLKGISVNTGRRLAIINNYTVGEGETFTIKHNGKPVTLRCVEIKDQTVVISADGATKELALRLK